MHAPSAGTLTQHALLLRPPAPSRPRQARPVVAAACAAMLLAALHRVSFSVLAVPIQAQFGLSLPQMGLLQSALLVGYVLGQVGGGLGCVVPWLFSECSNAGAAQRLLGLHNYCAKGLSGREAQQALRDPALEC